MYSPKPAPTLQQTNNNHLFDLLRLQLDRFPVHEDTLALVRLWWPPRANLSRKLRHGLLVGPFEENNGGLGCVGLDSLRNSQLDRMRETNFQVNELLARVFNLRYRDCLGFDRGPETNTNQLEDGDVAFRDTEDVVVKMLTDGS